MDTHGIIVVAAVIGFVIYVFGPLVRRLMYKVFGRGYQVKGVPSAICSKCGVTTTKFVHVTSHGGIRCDRCSHGE